MNDEDDGENDEDADDGDDGLAATARIAVVSTSLLSSKTNARPPMVICT
jgi:hypothetical protein